MTIIFFLGYSMLIAILAGYTSKFQLATHHWGLVAAGKESVEAIDARLNEATVGKKFKQKFPTTIDSGFQDMITPDAQTFRNLICILGRIFILVWGFVSFTWHVPIGVFILTFYISNIVKQRLPDVNASYYKNIIINKLEQKIDRLLNKPKNRDWCASAMVVLDLLKNSESDVK